MESYLDKFRLKLKQMNEPELPLVAPSPIPGDGRRYNIHKRSLPVGIDVIVVYNIESKEDAEYMLINARTKKGKQLFATRLYPDDARESKTIIYYDVVPTDATPRERSIFFNPVKASQPL